MAITIKHAKTDNISDWTQTDLDAQIALGNFPPGTVLADIVLPSDWNNSHTLSGTVPVANGGTGATTLTGYVKGNGTSAFTATTTVPSTDITGLGTMSTQNANSVTITGGSISGTTVSGYIPTTEKAAVNGVATLDGSGTVPISQLPAAVLGALSYQGTWNASTNTPTLTSSTGTKGYYYVVNIAGSTTLNGISDWQVGDWAVYNGSAWQKIDNTDAVTSVNGYTGTVVLTAADVSAVPYTGATGAVDLNNKSLTNISSLGINTTTVPTIKFRAFGDNGSTSRIAMRGYSSDANSSAIRVTKFRGTYAAPQAPQSGDSLGKFELAGYGTTSSDGYPQASFEGVATEAWGATARGTKTLIKVTPNTTTTQATAVTIDQDKSVTLAGALSVTGTTTLATSLSGLAKLTSGVVSTATSGSDYAPATSGSAILYGNGSGGFSSVTIGTGVSFASGTLSATGSGGTVTSVSGTAPVVSSGGTTPAISMAAATTSVNGYLTSTDWTTFNSKQAALVSGTNIKTVNSTSLLGSGDVSVGVTSVTGTAPIASSGGATPAISISQATTSTNGYLSSTDWNTFNGKQPAGTYVTSVGATSPVTSTGGTTPTIAMPAATTSVSGYLTSTDWNTFNNKGSGTVTSVSGTTGRITSTGGNTPVIDLASGVATAGTTGSSTLIPVVTIDTYGRVTSITTASNPQGTVTSVTGTAPVVSSGGANPAISMAAANTTTNGYLTSTDWNTFNGKGSGTVTSVAALTLGTTGTDLSSTVATGTTTPVITLQVPTASATNRGALSSTDWTTFNNKGSGTVTSVAVTAPSIFSVAGSPITSSGTIALTYSGTALPIANGGTGQTTASAAFNALSPLTTAGDILYGATSGAGTRLGIGTTGQVLTVSVGGLPTWSTTGLGTGTVTSVSVVSANGFAGTVATATTTPAITISTSITGVLKGNGTAVSAATAGTDYSAGTSALTTGIIKSTTTTGALSIAVAADFPTLNQNTTGTAANVTGTVAVANGGTGQTSYTNGQLLIGNTTGNTLAKTTLTAGTGISVTNGAGSITIGNTAPSIAWQSVQATGFTAVAGLGYPCNTTSAAFTVTLPASPSAGDAITLTDYAGTWATNNITIGVNGNKLNSAAANAILSTNRQSISLVYIDSTQGWVAFNGFLDVLPAQGYSIDFLVVGGGGGGGCGTNSGNNEGGGGGGAGGFRTSTQTINAGTVITVTVGGGGAAATGAGLSGTSGTASSFSGSGVTTISSAGGGAGGGNGIAGSTGGSGGGGGAGTAFGAGGAGNTPSTSPSQGSNGGAGASGGNGGGGGGASAVGGTGAGTGTGGAGTASSITGSSVTYAGGGGAGQANNNNAGGAGGGGAGARQNTSTSAAVAGTANLGGGGGGGAVGGTSAAAAGGSGVVILSVPTSKYSSTTTGSPTVTTSGSNTILKFTGSGSYTA
jgi:hypothetical protein